MTVSLGTRVRDGLPSVWNAVCYATGAVSGVLMVYPRGSTELASALTLVAVINVWAISFIGGIGVGLLLMHAAHTISLQ